MTEKCFDDGTIQAFLDGELDAGMAETVAGHTSFCDECSMLMATAEEETAIAFSALDQEFNTLVPTQRLWSKINDSIKREKQSLWKSFFAFLLQPSTAAFAGLLIIAFASLTLLDLKSGTPVNEIAAPGGEKELSAVQIAANVLPESNFASNLQPALLSGEPVTAKKLKNEFRTVKAAYIALRKDPAPERRRNKNVEAVVPDARESILGEESYIKTIATLAETVKSRKDEVLDASSRFAYERDLAITDDAIRQMRKEVKKNPGNEAAKQILRTSYQNKIDLLNSVADKTELMASLR